MSVGSTIMAGWYGQETRLVPETTRVLGAVREVAELTRVASGITISAAQLLERFMFTQEQQKTPVGDLSGGERRRLELMLVLMEAPNLLLLDEPTNDLDLDTLEALEEYLDGWAGALVVASHDRYFLDRVCSDIFSIEPDGSVLHHPGGWAAYRAHEAAQEAATQSPAAPAPKRRRPSPRQGLTYIARYELEQLDGHIEDLERRREALAAELDAAGADYDAAARIGKELDEVLRELDAAETRWLELSEDDA